MRVCLISKTMEKIENNRSERRTVMVGSDIGIDLGTANVLVYIKGKGVVLREPSVVAFDRDTNKIKAIGEDARLMLGRTPGNIVAVRPLRQGVISDYTVTEKMLRYFIQKSCGKSRFRKPRISVCVPSGVTEVEKKAVEDATYEAGAREVAIIEEPIAAAIGAGIDISRPCGNMIVDIGGGTSDIAVISLGGTVVSTSIKVAGDDFDDAIVRYMRKTHNLLIGERTAEEIKVKIGSAYKRPEVVSMDVRGRNLVTGLPKTITVTSDETLDALKEITSQIVEAVHTVLEKIPLTPIHVGLANLYAEVHRSDILINISYGTISDLYSHHVLKRTAGDIFFLVTDGRRICQVIRYNIQSALFIPHTGICCVQSSDHSSSSFQTNLCIINGRRVLFVRSIIYISSQSINFFTHRHVFLLKILQTYRFPLQLLSLDPRLS
jgi:rod shape-determining protein MreB and related proteins